MIIFLAVILFVIISELALLILVMLLKDEVPSEKPLTLVSILIPARNEEKNIPWTIKNLLDNNNDVEIEILVGDDNSSDNTQEIVKGYGRKDPRVKYFRINESEKKIGGKAGVLDILMNEAVGNIILVADADMTYSKDWVKSMAYHIQEETLVSSFTWVKGKDLWAGWQNLDWLINLAGVKLLSRIGYNLTAIGNNMGFTMSAYKKIPGFSKMKGTITEDMELLNQMKKAKVRQKLVFSGKTLGATQPASGWKSLIAQRLRWMSGAFTSPILIITGWLARVLIIPMCIALAFYSIEVAALLWASHWLLQMTILLIILSKLNLPKRLQPLLSFDLFYLGLNIVCLISYLSNNDIVWKGRHYSKKELKHGWIH